jgi:crossover junction endodeoxyribonuclease RuvC
VKVLGVDPGTAVLGYGIVESVPGRAGRLLECGVVRTTAQDPLPVRLRIIHDAIAGLIVRHQPHALALEKAFVGRNAHSTMTLSHARGVILLAAEQAGLAIGEYAPAVVKKTVVGRGAALKPQVGYMVQQLLRLTAPPEPADAADGVAIALTHLMLVGSAPGVRR